MEYYRIAITNFQPIVRTNQIKNLFNRLNIGKIISAERVSRDKIIVNINWYNNLASRDIYNKLSQPDTYVYIHDKPTIWNLKLLNYQNSISYNNSDNSAKLRPEWLKNAYL